MNFLVPKPSVIGPLFQLVDGVGECVVRVEYADPMLSQDLARQVGLVEFQRHYGVSCTQYSVSVLPNAYVFKGSGYVG